MNQRLENIGPENRLDTEGFTLLELLLAIFIFAMVVTTIFGSFNMVFSNAGLISASAEQYEMGKTCMNRMAEDLKSIYVAVEPAYTEPEFNDPPDPYRVFSDTSFTAGASFPTLRFTSFAHLPFGEDRREGIAEILYYITLTDEGVPQLRRADTLYPYERFKDNRVEEKITDPILCENVKRLEYIFHDEEEEEQETWNSDSEKSDYGTPRAIEIRLEIGDESASLSFETMIKFPVYRKQKED